MKATRAELATRLREEQTRYEALERCWQQAKDLAIKHAGDRDAAMRKIDLMRETYDARIESMFVDLRERTRERDAAQTEARKYAETRQLADDLQAELAAVKIALAESESVVKDWEFSSIQQVSEIGKTIGHMMMLATMVKRGLPAAEGVADYILSLELKPCAT